MSSSEVLENNVIISSRKEKYWGEYTKGGKLIKSFQTDRFSYRIEKYKFKNF